jgi:hypothetical protein
MRTCRQLWNLVRLRVHAIGRAKDKALRDKLKKEESVAVGDAIRKKAMEMDRPRKTPRRG